MGILEGIHRPAGQSARRVPVQVDADGKLQAGVSEGYTPLGYQQLTALGTASALTVPDGARLALLQAEGADVRWRDDGTDPTATVGMMLAVGTVMLYTGDLTAFRAIETAAGAKLNVSYYI